MGNPDSSSVDVEDEVISLEEIQVKNNKRLIASCKAFNEKMRTHKKYLLSLLSGNMEAVVNDKKQTETEELSPREKELLMSLHQVL